MNFPENVTKYEISEMKLNAVLRHFSPETFKAAIDYRRSGDPVYLTSFLIGALEHYAVPEKRPELCNARPGLRLVRTWGSIR